MRSRMSPVHSETAGPVDRQFQRLLSFRVALSGAMPGKKDPRRNTHENTQRHTNFHSRPILLCVFVDHIFPRIVLVNPGRNLHTDPARGRVARFLSWYSRPNVLVATDHRFQFLELFSADRIGAVSSKDQFRVQALYTGQTIGQLIPIVGVGTLCVRRTGAGD